MKIVLGADHAAYKMKEFVKKLLQSYIVEDVGTHNEDRTDYPDYARDLCQKVIKENSLGILLCGSGIGMSMAANRYQGIRAALCRSAFDAEMSKKHNNANVLCLGARVNSEAEIKVIVETWLKSSFEEGRHSDRLHKFENLGVKL